MAEPANAAQNAVVAAESLGIGSCYIGDVIENAEQMREALHLPEHVVSCLYAGVRPPDRTAKGTRPKPARFAKDCHRHARIPTANPHRRRTAR